MKIGAISDVHLDYAVSSPYKRSMDTIRGYADYHGLVIITDERLRERKCGLEQNNRTMFQKRWSNFNFHEEGGESIGMVQRRNMEAMLDILQMHEGENIILGTHGTALSSILNFYNPTFQYESFIRIIDYMPYIIRLDFKGTECIGMEELLIVEKEFKKD